MITFFGLILTLPILLVVVIFGYFDTGSPVFTQKRVGKNKKPFTLIKFRTMSVETKSVASHLASTASITKMGGFLRKTKIDELPQLWNVLIGQMSLVGPRPDVAGYADRLKGRDRLILSIRPGITSPASLKYKNEEEILAAQDEPTKYNDTVIWPDKVRINCEYIRNYSFVKDLKYILKTIVG